MDNETLFRAGSDVIKNVYHPIRHNICAVILGESGELYSAINMKGCAYNPCAEASAMSQVFKNKDKPVKIVAVGCNANIDTFIISPCGNCRQLFVDYNKDLIVLMPSESDDLCQEVKAIDLMFNPYISNHDPIELRMWAK